MIDARFVPITQWPGKATPSTEQRDGRFRASYADTLALLDTELNALTARNITIQAFFHVDDIRHNGWPNVRAVPTAPGLVLSFAIRSGASNALGTLSFPCDTFTTFDDNLRAIALTLEALRKIERYGVAKREEQYTGWKQLGSAAPTQGDGNMSRVDAYNFMKQHAGLAEYETIVTSGDWTRAYRSAAARLHPDNKATGNHALFLKLQRAKEVLGL